MPTRPLSDELLQEAVSAFQGHGTKTAAAAALGISRTTFQDRLKVAAKRGLMGFAPVLPGFQVSKTSTTTNSDGELRSQTVQQKPEHGPVFEMPATHVLGKITVNRDAEGRVIQDWVRVLPDANLALETIRTVVDELKLDLPRLAPTPAPTLSNVLLCNQYTLTDSHFGMLAWGEETRNADYDLKIAEQMVMDWFTASIQMSPPAQVGIFAQLGDLMHHDSLRSVTPTHAHVLDADSRLQKIIRVVIRCVKRVINMLLEKHPQVHVIMALGNHDESSSGWLRELFASLYENEPRLTVDVSPDPFYAFEWGRTALFYHHGHKRNIDNVASVFVAKFREIYGRALRAYGHIGHLHSAARDEKNNMMIVERHRTLAPPDAHGSLWPSGRDASVITYHKDFGEVFRSVLSPEMVAGASLPAV